MRPSERGHARQAAGLFAVTNIDDIVVLALFFAQAPGSRSGTTRIIAGQHLGSAGILVAALAVAFGAGFLPGSSVPTSGCCHCCSASARPGPPGAETTMTTAPPPAPAALAGVFKALGDPTRVKLLSLIATAGDAGACVCDLIEPVRLSQPTVSHHMRQLVDAGLITREQRGKWAYYRLVDGALAAVASTLAPV